jgi:hypothetical protein
VYGPVRTVVWQGSVGDRRPYADQRRFGRASQMSELATYPALCRVPDYAECCRIGLALVRWDMGAAAAPI